ncbi:hypothetical protein [Desulfofustis limnaeus]|uniref:Single-stranded DNA-binding protein n=1 Tax=Desulfofustis limnaeus TaxID=2740163 RepID=A0ABN6M536_9BACT|nr:hypothetical protein [Desulfofustis limnaeus]BDD88009.1 hypothetical protein DPPLL_23740 [Desulfofustis limnaeus]
MERNKVEMTGTVSKLRSIPTKKGTAMVKFFINVDQHRFLCVAFAGVADAIQAAGEGAEIGVSGTAAINSWQPEPGQWRNDFQLFVWTVKIGSAVTVFQKEGKPTAHKNRNQGIPEYAGGPF